MRDILKTIQEEQQPGGILAGMPEDDDMNVEEILQLSPGRMDRTDAIYDAFLFAYVLGVRAGRRACGCL